jgi:large subunit ribosomal protein L10
MKTKAQKEEELKEGEALLAKSTSVLFFDFSKLQTRDLRLLRMELKKSGNPMLVMKKRLVDLLLMKRGVEAPEQFKTSVATVFVSDMEAASASVYKFFKALEKEKKVEGVKMLGGYNVAEKTFITKEMAIQIGSLPPREVLLAQLLGMLAAPIRSFLYVLDQKSKQTA